jgi:hypothetical protein
LADGRIVPFARLGPKPGRRWCGWVGAVKQAGWQRCGAVGLWRAPYAASWLLLTNWPKAQGQWYGWRMGEEWAFRACKSTGWPWQRRHIWAPEAANRLWWVLALASVWALRLGTHVLCTPALRRELARGRNGRPRGFSLGLRLFTRWLALGRRLYDALLLIPHRPIRLKSVV